MKEERKANKREKVNLGHNNRRAIPMIPMPLAGREMSVKTHISIQAARCRSQT